jgi:hypothetical protein
MNNLIVSKKTNAVLGWWLVVMIVLCIWQSIPSPATTPLSGGVGLADMSYLLTRPALLWPVRTIYFVGEIWVFLLFYRGLKDQGRRLRIAMIAFIVLFVLTRLLASFEAVAEMVRIVANGLYILVALILSMMVITRFGGRLRRLGFVAVAVIAVPALYGLIIFLVQDFYEANQGLLSLLQMLLLLALQIVQLWAMRTCFIPSWQ